MKGLQLAGPVLDLPQGQLGPGQGPQIQGAQNYESKKKKEENRRKKKKNDQ